MLLQKFVDSSILFYSDGAISPEVSLAVSHLCNMRRDIDTQTSRTGGVLSFHTWKCVGPDHYADAILYAMIAADMAVARGRLQVVSIDRMDSEVESYRRSIYSMQSGDILVPVFPDLENTEFIVSNHGLALVNPYANLKR